MTMQMLFNTSVQVLLLSLVPGLPLVVACTLLVQPLQRIGLRLAPWSALPALGAALFLKPGINLEVAWFFMGGRMGIDLLAQRFLLLAALVWLLSAFFGRTYLRHDPRRASFFFFYLISMAFNFGLILAQDMLGFYLFFGLMSFSAYGLIVHTRSRKARQAGMVYIVMVMLGEVLLVAGMMLLAGRLPDLELATIATSRPDGLILGLLFLGFAIKAGALPLHVWLPLAHPVAPVPASAVLSGVMIKAGLLGWLRFLPAGQDLALSGWGGLLVVLGIVAAFYGVVCGLGQKEAKAVLAYSSVSQMGLMTMVIGCGLLAPVFWPQVTNAVSLYALHHGMVKASLFLGAGLVKRGGEGRMAGWLMLFLLLLALTLAGLPLTSGAIVKFAIKDIVHGLPMPWAASMEVILPLAALATMLLLCHFLKVVSATSPRSAHVAAGMLVPWFVLITVVLGLLWVWPARPDYAGHLAEAGLFWQGLWPVVVAWLVMGAVWRWWPGAKKITIPAGDILWLVYGRRHEAGGMPEGTVSGAKNAFVQAGKFQGIYDVGRGLEKKIRRWGIVGSCYLFLCFLLLFLVMHS